MNENIIKGVFSAMLAAFTVYLGQIALPAFVLLAVMTADYITGMVKAWITMQISSRIGIAGILKKLCYLIVVCSGMAVDYIFTSALAGVGFDYGEAFSFGILVIIWLIINELVSILENLSTIGIPLPGFLKKIIGKLKQTVDATPDVRS
jgi:toxin secretion/phage lysis holin